MKGGRAESEAKPVASTPIRGELALPQAERSVSALRPVSHRAHPKLLFVLNAATIGGAERHTIELAGALGALGFAAEVFAVKPGEGLEAAGVLRPDPSSFSLPGRIRQLASHVLASRPDVIVAVNQRPLALAYLARQLARGCEPICGILHSTILRNRKERCMQLGYTPLYNHVDAVVFVSERQRDYWHGNGLRPRRSATILNGVDLGRFSPEIAAAFRSDTRERLGIGTDDLVLGCCAVLRSEKNHLQLVAATARLRAQGLRARALLVGDGPLRAAIEQRADALGIREHVLFAGMQQDVRPFTAAFDIAVLCSTAIETMSLSILETMAMGVPAVMSRIGGASEIVAEGGNGCLFPVGDEDALVRALLSLFAPDRRAAAGAQARATVETKFAYPDMVDSYAALFRSLVPEPVHRLTPIDPTL